MCVSRCSVGRPRKRLIDTVKQGRPRKRWIDTVQQGEWSGIGVCEGECIGRSPGDEPLTLVGLWGAHDRFMRNVHEYNWNSLVFFLTLPIFNDTGSLGYLGVW